MSQPRIPSPLAHAYIVTGGGADSRRAYAQRLAQAYVCSREEAPCGRCRDCEKAAADIHPDVTVLSPAEGKKEIVVDQARALRADAYIRPNEAGRKVYLIDPADSLNPAAQNTLLKVLEEGPPYAAFLLVTGQAGALLETLRSRCELLSLPPEEEQVDPALLEQAQTLGKLLLEGDELALAAFLARLETAKLKGADVLDLYQLTEEVLAQQLASRPRDTAPLLERLRAFRALRPYNVGAGSLLGALAVGRFSIS